MPMTPYVRVTSGFSSTSRVTTRSRPASSVAIRSSTGLIILQGGHQSAVKSTSTGVAAASTSRANPASVVVGRDMRSPRGSAVDLGDQPVVRAGLLAALADEAGGYPAAAAPVPIDDVLRRARAEVPLTPVGHGREQRQQVGAGVGEDVLGALTAAGQPVGPGREDAGGGQPAQPVG